MKSTAKPPLDPLYRSSLREARWIMMYWASFFAWTIGYSWLFGYTNDGGELVTVFGMPSWVFWGIFLPWIVSGLIGSWYALTKMEDHPLDDSDQSGSADE